MRVAHILQALIDISGRTIEDIANEADVDASRFKAAVRRGYGLSTEELSRIAEVLGTTVESIYVRAELVELAGLADSIYREILKLDARGLTAVSQLIDAELKRVNAEQHRHYDRPIVITGNTKDPSESLRSMIMTGLYMQQVSDDNISYMYKRGDILLIRAGQTPGVGDVFLYNWRDHGYLFVQGPSGPLPLSDAQPNDVILREGHDVGVVIAAIHVDPDTGLPTSEYAGRYQTLNLNRTTSPS